MSFEKPRYYISETKKFVSYKEIKNKESAHEIKASMVQEGE
jgi:hypothetical protein|tara:strand:+ start:390 stop:512 length:123 start_codon:yes stop_codon:yes gene_type:complete